MLTGSNYYLNISSGSGIIKKVALFFNSYRYKKFSPAETSKISEFRWLYSTSYKKISPKNLLVGFSHDILHRLRLSTTPNSALYQFVSGFAKIWLKSPGLNGKKPILYRSTKKKDKSYLIVDQFPFFQFVLRF